MTRDSSAISMPEIAELVGGRLEGRDDVIVGGINTLIDASDDDISMIQDRKFAERWPASSAAAALVAESAAGHVARDTRPLIIVERVEYATVALLERFQRPPTLPDPGVHDTAVVHPSAVVDPSARIGPLASVGAGAQIGAGVVIESGARVGAGVVIGDGSVIHANVAISERCELGRGVIIHSNASIGADGFGYLPRQDGKGLLKVPHIGTVILEDGVEVGAGTCIDRGKFGPTTIGAGTKLDNLVQIGHNCRTGKSCVIAALSGLSGSVTLGHGVMIGGGAGVSDHLTVHDGATIAGGSGVTENVPAGETWFWYPAQPATRALRQIALLRKLPDLIHRESGRPKGDA